MLYLGASHESGIDDSLSGDGLAASSTLIRGDQNTGLAILDAVSE